MPNRIIKETVCTSDTLASVSAEAERLWWRIVAQADDFGRFDARPETIRGQCLTAMLDKVTNGQVRCWLEELRASGLVHLYTCDGKPYLQIATWDKHQKRRAKFSKYPAPADGCQLMQAPETTCEQVQANASKCEHVRTSASNCEQVQASADNCEHLQTSAGLVVFEERGIEESRSRSRGTEEPTTTTADDDGFAGLVKFWNDNNFGVIGSMIQEQLHSYLDDGLPADLIRWAMEEAVASGGKTRNWGYVRSILNRLIKDGIHDRPAAEADKRAKSPPAPAKAEFKPAEVWS